MAPNSCSPCRNTTAWHSPAAAFGGDVHVDGLVLDGLKRADGDAELLALLDMLESEVEDTLAGADGGDRDAGEGQMARFLRIGVQPFGVGQPHTGDGHVGDVQYRVEYLAAPHGRVVG